MLVPIIVHNVTSDFWAGHETNCSYIWLLPDLPFMEGVMFILQVGVGVVHPCSFYHI